jgi:hypothetical protein
MSHIYIKRNVLTDKQNGIKRQQVTEHRTLTDVPCALQQATEFQLIYLLLNDDHDDNDDIENSIKRCVFNNCFINARLEQ